MTVADTNYQQWEDKQLEVNHSIRNTVGEIGLHQLMHHYETRVEVRKLLDKDFEPAKLNAELHNLLVKKIDYLHPAAIRKNEETVSEALPLERIQKIFAQTHNGQFDPAHPSPDYYALLNTIGIQIRYQAVFSGTLEKNGLNEADIAAVSKAAENYVARPYDGSMVQKYANGSRGNGAAIGG